MKKETETLNPETMELTVGLSATINTGQYENISPLYSVKMILPKGVDTQEEITKIKLLLNEKLKEDYESVRIEKVLKNSNIRTYDRLGKKYPSVTSVINQEPIGLPPEKMIQYSARGTIIHEQIDVYLNLGTYLEPEYLPSIKEELMILSNGSLGLRYDDVDFRGFCEKYKDEITFSEVSCDIIYNDKWEYAGTPDRIGTYKNKKALFDFKTTSNYDKKKLNKYYKQVSAYNECDINADYLIIVPLTNKKKEGYDEPFVITKEESIKYFNEFLNDRRAFKKVYGF